MGDCQYIYLALVCCADEYERRDWCKEDVWPCQDCHDPGRAITGVYKLNKPATRAWVFEARQIADLR